jgi:hypothetical protein
MKRLLLILILLLPQLLAAQSADRSAVQSVDRTAAQTADRIPANSAAVPAVNMPSEPWTAIRWGSTPCGGSMRWAAT